MLQEQYIDTPKFQILEAPTEMEAFDYKILSWLGWKTQTYYGKLKAPPKKSWATTPESQRSKIWKLNSEVQHKPGSTIQLWKIDFSEFIKKNQSSSP